MKQIRGYIFSRPFLDERVPQNVQNLVIREFCKNEDIIFPHINNSKDSELVLDPQTGMISREKVKK